MTTHPTDNALDELDGATFIERLLWEVYYAGKDDAKKLAGSNRVVLKNKADILEWSDKRCKKMIKTPADGKGDTYYKYPQTAPDGKAHHTGGFATAEEAALAYNKLARELFGEFAYQNVIPSNGARDDAPKSNVGDK